ncbi:osteopetrosis-associated transmembrane protein 1 [Betta splendens]|uniref:Osteopetrosis-associated transmembrane protein 1 n=1 Tax=Betta splendens TaxID=158456 RepID=A0A6P7LTF6_BETSP|nr:osteopetrosis-associated transmembrane protein 1 [Betta splendens]
MITLEPGNQLCRAKEEQQMLLLVFSTMSPNRNCGYFILFSLTYYSLVFGDGTVITASGPADQFLRISPSSRPAPSAASERSSGVGPRLDSSFSPSLLSSFPEGLEINDYCIELLHAFGQRYVAYVNCLVPAARPVKMCQNCFSSYGSVVDIYANITDKTGPGNVSCRDSLLRSDRVMVVYSLYSSLKDLWEKARCDKCVTENRSLTNDTLYFTTALNQTLTCFEKYQEGNHTELCKNCRATYKGLNALYSGMEKNQSLCIDIEDAMNLTRRLWSKSFACSLSREETVPVIAVSSFMLFLPIIFYLSSFLHSEQKKRKLIHPKRAKSYASLMNIQDKLN